MFASLAPNDPSMATESDCETVREQVIAQRLSYFMTANRFSSTVRLVDWWDVLTPELFICWCHLLDELDIANQVYLYVLSDNGMPVDLLLAFLVELAEPLVEIVNEELSLFPSLCPSERGTSLKQCLNALINTYGRLIFKREMRDGYDDFLKKLVASRVRIMHIKIIQKKGNMSFYDGKSSIFYIRKLSLLYRVILLELLKCPEASFEGRLEEAIRKLDEWFDEVVSQQKRTPRQD